MDDHCFRREHGAVNPRRMSAAPEPGWYHSLQDGEALEGLSAGEGEAAAAAPGAPKRRPRWSHLESQGGHRRHMPIGPLKLPIPRKSKEKMGKLLGNNHCLIVTIPS